MLSLIWKGPEIEDRHQLDQEGNVEARWSPGEFSKQGQVPLFLKLKGGRPPLRAKRRVYCFKGISFCFFFQTLGLHLGIHGWQN